MNKLFIWLDDGEMDGDGWRERNIMNILNNYELIKTFNSDSP